LLKLIVHHAPKLLVFVCSLHLRLSKPQWHHVIRLADALIVSDTRHKTIAGLYRLIVDAPDASNGADSLRISPWTAEDLRAPLRLFTVTDLVAYANETNEWTLYVSLDDSLGEKDKDTRHLEAVAYHHDHTKSQGKKNGSVANFVQGGMKGQVALVCVGITQPERRTVRPHCGLPHGLLQAALCAACA